MIFYVSSKSDSNSKDILKLKIAILELKLTLLDLQSRKTKCPHCGAVVQQAYAAASKYAKEGGTGGGQPGN